MRDIKVYPGDCGFQIRVNTGVTLTGASVGLYVIKPALSTTLWTGTIYDETYITHTFAAGELDTSGTYKVQAVYTIGTYSQHGETFDFIVTALGS